MSESLENDCGTLKGAQRHLHSDEPVCIRCIGYLDNLIGDVLSTTQHGTEAGYHRHIRDARRRREWDRVWSPEEGVLTDRFYDKGESDEYTGWVPGFLWPPIADCPHMPTCREAHALVKQTQRDDVDAERDEIVERGRKARVKQSAGFCRPGEAPHVDSVLRKEWRKFVSECPEVKAILDAFATCLVDVTPNKLVVTLSGQKYNVPHPLMTEELTSIVVSLMKLKGDLPNTKIPLQTILAHRVVEAGMLNFDGKVWSAVDIEDMFS